MRRIEIIAFTRRGCQLAMLLAGGLGSSDAYAGCAFRVSGPEKLACDLGVSAYDSLGAWTGEAFQAADALVFVGAAGIAVRAIAPHVHDKFSDPAVVCVDEAGAFSVPVLSGHVGGANGLARAIARVTGGQAAISTATDVNGCFAVDEWAARHNLQLVERELAREVSARILEGGKVGFAADFRLDGRLPERFRADGGDDLGFVVSLDDEWAPFERTLHLVPRAVTVGVGCRKGTPAAALRDAVDAALAAAKVSPRAVAALASIDVKRDEPAIAELASQRGWQMRFYTAEELRAVPGDFASSAFVEQTVGVGNVCERAALCAGGRLLAGRAAAQGVTVALAVAPCSAAVAEPAAAGEERAGTLPASGGAAGGRLSVVGLGPGGALDMTRRAHAAIAACDLIVGYTVYNDLLKGEFGHKEMIATPMRKEVERCRIALREAAAGRDVAMVCSGDPGVYGMAGLVLALAGEYPGVTVRVIPGVSAANGGAAVLGAPLMHDYCVISLSDLLTPWDLIERRLEAAARADFVVTLYNPSSHKRPDYLQRACDVLLRHKSPATVCGIVRNIGREGQQSGVLTLGELRDTPADMFTTVFVGNAQTAEAGGFMVTPRGYLQRDGSDGAGPAGAHGADGPEGA